MHTAPEKPAILQYSQAGFVGDKLGKGTWSSPSWVSSQEDISALSRIKQDSSFIFRFYSKPNSIYLLFREPCWRFVFMSLPKQEVHLHYN